MNETNRITENTAQTVVFLETLAALVEKSPESYSAAASKDLAGHLRGMAEAVTADAHVNPALDWHNELVAVLFAPEHRPNMH
jgi:hypothetical protein